MCTVINLNSFLLFYFVPTYSLYAIAMIFFAMGEAMAHLHCLYYRGALARETGADGVLRYVRKGAPHTEHPAAAI